MTQLLYAQPYLTHEPTLAAAPKTQQTLYDTWRRAGFRQLLSSRAPKRQHAMEEAMLTTRFHAPVMSEADVRAVLDDIPDMYKESAMDTEEIQEMVAEKKKSLKFLDLCLEINKTEGDPQLIGTWQALKQVVDNVVKQHKDNFTFELFQRVVLQILQQSRMPMPVMQVIMGIFQAALARMKEKDKTKTKADSSAAEVAVAKAESTAVSDFDAQKAADLALCVDVFREQMLTALPNQVPVVVPFAEQLRRMYSKQKSMLDRLAEPQQVAAAHERAASIIDTVTRQVVVQATGLDMEIVQEQVHLCAKCV